MAWIQPSAKPSLGNQKDRKAPFYPQGAPDLVGGHWDLFSKLKTGHVGLIGNEVALCRHPLSRHHFSHVNISMLFPVETNGTLGGQ